MGIVGSDHEVKLYIKRRDENERNNSFVHPCFCLRSNQEKLL